MDHKKRPLALLLALCVSLLLTACGSKEQEEQADYSTLAGIYVSHITMTETQGVDLYLNISQDGSFIFARDLTFASQEKGAGTLGKDAEKQDAFLYTVVNGKEVEAGTYTATYQLQDGKIQFTSPMWFGSTEPKIIGENDTVTYPCFEKYDPTQAAPSAAEPAGEKEETKSEEQEHSQPSQASQPAQSEQPSQPSQPSQPEQPSQPAASFQEGTYTGSTSKYVDAMGSDIRYDVTVVFQGGSYSYTVNITVSGGMSYSTQESYSGGYSVSGDTMTLTGQLSSGTISGSSVTLSGMLSSFAGQTESVTVTK